MPNHCFSPPTDVIKAACIQADAAVFAGDMTFWAGCIAILGGAAVLVAAYVQRRAGERIEADKAESYRQRVAQAFQGEINSLQAFLVANDVVKTLREKANSDSRLFFHPGEHWLQTFVIDPLTIGVFEGDIAAQVVRYYNEMLNELGRLRWMHKLSSSDIRQMTLPELHKQMIDSANTLDRLSREAVSITLLLNLEIKRSRQRQKASRDGLPWREACVFLLGEMRPER